MRSTVANRKIAEWPLISVSNHPDCSGPSLIRFAPASFERSVWARLAFGIHPEDFDRLVGFVAEHNIEFATVRLRRWSWLSVQWRPLQSRQRFDAGVYVLSESFGYVRFQLSDFLGNDVHFSGAVYTMLAEKIAESISAQLGTEADAAE